MVLDRRDLLKPLKPYMELVPVPEMGGDVYVRAMSGRERDDFERWLLAERKSDTDIPEGFRERMLLASLSDENGRPLINEDDISQLMAQPSNVVEALFAAACRINGMGGDALEDKEKN